MGKNGKFGKDYGKVVGKDSASRPGWKGPGYIKKAEPPAKAKAPEAERIKVTTESVIPTKLQQLLLNLFRDTFPEVLTSGTLQPLLQEVKASLYERDFSRAFGKQEFLEAYSVRWSPSRALCYASILGDLQEHLTEIFPFDKSTLNVVCVGGGAAEVVAFGGFLRFLHETSAPAADETGAEALSNLSMAGKRPDIDLLLVDAAQWGGVVRMLDEALSTPPALSKYASSSVKEANSSLIAAGSIATTFRSADVLGLAQGQFDDMVGKGPMLITLFFTLNELYTASIGKTTGFLLSLTSAAKPGTLLLVVDSPGSYSETKVGTEAKRYPMQWLLDHILLGTEKSRGQESTANWLKVLSDDSRWFRLSDNLRYPIPLENMRYQISLYRRL
jgi:25S rRNA (uracil2843-N3)-methyltransferase